jgi:NTE family protein
LLTEFFYTAMVYREMTQPTDAVIDTSLIQNLKTKKVGLALGAGGAMGLAHIGVIRFLEEQGIRVHSVAGTSVGALVGALYAAGRSAADMELMARKINWFSIIRPNLFRFKGIFQHRGLEVIIKRYLGVETFADLHLPFTAVATDFDNGTGVYFNSGPLIPAIMASSCVPVAFEPVRYRRHTYVDGFLSECVPIRAARSMGADFIIAVDLMHSWKNPSFRTSNIYTVAIKAMLIGITNAFTAAVGDNADIIISPSFSYMTFLSRAAKKASITKGYEAAREAFQNKPGM